MDENIFYNEKYDVNKKLGESPNSLSIIHMRFTELRKFECYRNDAVCKLLPKGDKYLDVGCGTGSLLLAGKNKFAELYGTDIVKQRFVETQDITNIHFKVSNINNGLAYEDCFFNAVTCVAVLEHLFDPYSAIREINRVLKDDGILILQVPNIAWLPHRLCLFFGKLPLTGTPFNFPEHGWDGGYLYYFTMSSLIELLCYDGFEIIGKKTSGIFARYRNVDKSSWWRFNNKMQKNKNLTKNSAKKSIEFQNDCNIYFFNDQ